MISLDAPECVQCNDIFSYAVYYLDNIYKKILFDGMHIPKPSKVSTFYPDPP